MYIIKGIREILYELIKSKNPLNIRFLRVLFRFQLIRLFKRFLHDYKYNIRNVSSLLFKNGFQVLDRDLPKSLIEETKELIFKESDSENYFNGISEVLNFKGKRVHARYNSEDPHLNSKIIHDYAYEKNVYSLVETYLGKNVKLAHSSCWVTIPNVLKDNNFEFGFHMDIGSWKWLNVFVYLDDVCIENGPHSAIKGTHNKRHFTSFLERRLTFKRAVKHYGKQNIHVFTGKLGTTIIEDTGNYHRAMPITKGHRHILQYVFTNFTNSNV